MTSKPRSLLSDLVFLTAFSGAAVLLAGALLVLFCLVMDAGPRRQEHGEPLEASRR